MEETMNRSDFLKIEEYMLSCMNEEDITHGKNHIYRVLTNAIELMKNYDVENDVLIAACLLHDIARDREAMNLKIDHAIEGSKMAYGFLKSIGWSNEKAEKVKICITYHKKKRVDLVVSNEAKLLYDADKLDGIGAIGIARYLVYGSQVSQSIYPSRMDKKTSQS